MNNTFSAPLQRKDKEQSQAPLVDFLFHFLFIIITIF